MIIEYANNSKRSEPFLINLTTQVIIQNVSYSLPNLFGAG